MPLHFLDPLQFQLQKFDCIIIDQDSSFAELARGVAELTPWRGKFSHHDLFSLNEDYLLSYRDTWWGLPGVVLPYCALLKWLRCYSLSKIVRFLKWGELAPVSPFKWQSSTMDDFEDHDELVLPSRSSIEVTLQLFLLQWRMGFMGFARTPIPRF